MSPSPREGRFYRAVSAGCLLLVVVQAASFLAWNSAFIGGFSALPTLPAILVALGDLVALVVGAVAVSGLRRSVKAVAHAEDRAASAQYRGDLLETVLVAGQELWLRQDRESIMQAVAEIARELMQAVSASAYLRDDENQEMLKRVALAPEQATMHGPSAIPLPTIFGIREQSSQSGRRLLAPVQGERGVLLGLLRLDDVPDTSVSEQEKALMLLAAQAAVALRGIQLRERAEAQASEDSLTGLLNHRAFQTRLEGEVVRARRGGHSLAVMMIDLDDFGTINNMYGHQIGDATLTAAATTMRTTLRTSDLLARYGGDEFSAILPETDIQEASAVAERLCTAIASHPVVVRGTTISVTASIGVAVLGRHGDTRKDLIRAADQATYAAKRSGKGRVCQPEETSPTFDRNPVVLATKLENANMAAVEALAVAVDAKDAYTRGHSQRVSAYAEALARAMGLSPADVARVRVAGLLHDIGKIGVPDAILTKLGPLTDDEFAVLEQHPVVGERMLAAVPFLRNIAPAVRHHHERWDGMGYPDGIIGEEIPQDAAIIMVADAFDAMTSSRTYRPALTIAEARRRVMEGSGTQFAPAVVEAFERAAADGTLKPLSPGGTMPLRASYNARASAGLRGSSRAAARQNRGGGAPRAGIAGETRAGAAAPRV